MRIRGATVRNGELAALDVGVVLSNVRKVVGARPSTSGFDCVLKLGPDGTKYRRMSADKTRWVAAVCYHGHLDWMDRLFVEAPGAIISTGHMGETTYTSRDDLWAKCGDVAERNIGGEAHPVEYQTACCCSRNQEEDR